jgi:IS1 family transposase
VNTEDFISKIRWATAAVPLDVSTDALQPYESAIDAGLYDRASHTEVAKLFSNRLDRVSERCSPAKFVCVQKDTVSGMPDLDRASTSHVERKNGTVRQWCKRLTRLTYAFSKKWENLKAALALHFAHYNFCRVHGSLSIMPAMAAGISDHVWELEELINSISIPWRARTSRARRVHLVLCAAGKLSAGKPKTPRANCILAVPVLWPAVDSLGVGG